MLISLAPGLTAQLSFAAGDMLLVLQHWQQVGWCYGRRESDDQDAPAGDSEAEFDDIFVPHGRFPAALVQRFGMDF